MTATFLDRVSAVLDRRLDEIEQRASGLGILGNGLSQEEEAASRELLGLAEHARKVERDKADLLIRLVGMRAASLSPEEVAALLARYQDDPLKLLGGGDSDES
jgi:hypothetical protein